ncbi:hypothetical protein [Streptomyces sp. NPDC098781]|uniref:hypothetical protein n=1 Tax=Streptomyces sp. NPDC098781 TaxID=3366097 RepID=UPI003803B9D0
MRAPTVLAAVALAGTVLFVGAGQALADEDEMGNAGTEFGTSSPAAPTFDQGAFGSGQGASGFGEAGSGFGDAGSGFDLG